MKKQFAVLFVTMLLLVGLSGCDGGLKDWLSSPSKTASLAMASLQKGDVFTFDGAVDGVMYVLAKDTASVTVSSCARAESLRATAEYFAGNQLVKYGEQEKSAVCPELTRSKVVASVAMPAPAKRPLAKKPAIPPTGGCSS